MTTETRSLWPRLLLVGDSITEMSFGSVGNWGSLLADSLQRRCDVIPRGFGGYNSRQWQSIARYVPLESLRADVVIIWLGANDACLNDNQHVPVPEYKTNLDLLVSFFKTEVGVSDVVILTPPPCNTEAMDPNTAVGRSEALTAEFANACIQAAEDIGVTYIDLHTLFKEQSDWESLLSDGLHLSPAGAELVHSVVFPVVAPLVYSRGPQNMADDERILPDWPDAANVNPCPDIENWVVEHPLPDETKKNRK